MNPRLRAYNAMLRAQVRAQQQLDESAVRVARWEAIGATAASIAQASVGNPMWSSAVVATAGAVFATLGKAVDISDPNGKFGNIQKPFKTLGYGMMAFAGAKEAGNIVADDISKIAAAFRGGSNAQAMSLAFDVPNSVRGSAGGASVQIGGGGTPPLPTGGSPFAPGPTIDIPRRSYTVSPRGGLSEVVGPGPAGTVPLLP